MYKHGEEERKKVLTERQWNFNCNLFHCSFLLKVWLPCALQAKLGVENRYLLHTCWPILG